MTEDKILQQGYRKYQGETLTIYYHRDICEHAGECVRGAPEVFDVDRRPWIIPHPEQAENTIKTIKKCPTGALKYKVAGQEEISP